MQVLARRPFHERLCMAGLHGDFHAGWVACGSRIGWLGGALIDSRWGRGIPVQSISRGSSLALMRSSALSKRRELRSELAMKVRAVAREMLMRFWQASLRIFARNSLSS